MAAIDSSSFAMDFRRVIRHLATTQRVLRRLFPPRTLNAIEQAITQSERSHYGEIRFAVEAALETGPVLRGQSARERAIEVFAELHVWDTEQNSGVLIYLLLADHDVEIVADRGIDRRVSQEQWETICREMETAFSTGDFEGGSIKGIQKISKLLEREFPAQGDNPNELPNKPIIR